ncbi:MAG: ABC transporter substrate-binding protein [Actinomycetota bacterium]|nr:ABC transporter substrate-binding protein [Actinomycetota bacterium]
MEHHAQSLDEVPRRAEGGGVDRRRFLGQLAAAGLVASGAEALFSGASAEAAVAAGTTLRLRANFDIQDTDPAFWPTHIDEWVALSSMEGLVSFKPGTFDNVKCLAETLDLSKDGLRVHFTLKKGVEFQGGYGEMTSDDVKYSYERIAGLTKPNLHAVYQGDWGALQRVKTEGKYAGTIILKEKFAPLSRSTMPAGAGLVVSKKAVEKLGKKFKTHPIGTGPYEFTSWTPKQKIVMNRFAKYAGSNKAFVRGPFFESINIIPIVNDSAAETALRAGDLDFTEISTGSVDRLKADSRFQSVSRNTLDYQFLAMNVTDALLKDINLRMAIRSAIDVPSIIEAAYDGKWTRANAIIPKNMGLGYWKEAPAYQRDVDKAKAFLAKTGQSNITLSLATQDDEADKTVVQVIQSNLKDIGVTTELRVTDPATFNAIPGAGGGGKNRQLVYGGYVTEPDPSWSTVWFTCAQNGLWNWDNWCDKGGFDRLHYAAIKETNPAKRQKLYEQLQKVWDAEASMVWVAYPTKFYAGRKGLTPALRPDGHLIPYAFRAA